MIKTNNSITIEDISKALGINIRNTKKNIAKLKALGVIKRVGSDKAGSWELQKRKKIIK